jgi:hypothetical protein
MSATVKIGDESVCPGCETTPIQEHIVQCYICKLHYHAVCEGANEVKLGSATMVKTFSANSTKSNFQFFCDVCLTQFEKNLVITEDQKITGLVKKVNTMENKLDEITKLLKANPRQKAELKPGVQSIWQDKEKLATVKAPPEAAVLVLKSSQTAEQNKEIRDIVQQTVVQNKIPVTQSYTNKISGDTVMFCETVDDRDKLKNLVSHTDNEIIMNTPAAKRPSITIVGLKSEYGKEEIIEMLALQNEFIKGFPAIHDNIHEHIEIFAVRPLKNNQTCYQAFANVSTTLREGLNIYKNKVTIGLATCKIYDRYHIKRCNICQHFGHYMSDCPTPEEPACGKCGANHNTNECSSETPNCVNCVRDNATDCGHHVFSHKCPSLKRQQEEKKKRMNSGSLNFYNRNPPPQR